MQQNGGQDGGAAAQMGGDPLAMLALQLQQAAAERSSTLAAQEASLAARQAEAAQLCARLEALEQHLQHRHQELARREAAVAAQEAVEQQLQARSQKLDHREAAVRAREADVQRRQKEAEAMHSRNLGVRASLEAAHSAAHAAFAALQSKIESAQQLIADLRTAQAAAAAAKEQPQLLEVPGSAESQAQAAQHADSLAKARSELQLPAPAPRLPTVKQEADPQPPAAEQLQPHAAEQQSQGPSEPPATTIEPEHAAANAADAVQLQPPAAEPSQAVGIDTAQSTDAAQHAAMQDVQWADAAELAPATLKRKAADAQPAPEAAADATGAAIDAARPAKRLAAGEPEQLSLAADAEPAAGVAAPTAMTTAAAVAAAAAAAAGQQAPMEPADDGYDTENASQQDEPGVVPRPEQQPSHAAEEPNAAAAVAADEAAPTGNGGDTAMPDAEAADSQGAHAHPDSSVPPGHPPDASGTEHPMPAAPVAAPAEGATVAAAASTAEWHSVLSASSAQQQLQAPRPPQQGEPGVQAQQQSGHPQQQGQPAAQEPQQQQQLAGSVQEQGQTAAHNHQQTPHLQGQGQPAAQEQEQAAPQKHGHSAVQQQQQQQQPAGDVQDKCPRCGGPPHSKKACKIARSTCRHCKKRGHMMKKCPELATGEAARDHANPGEPAVEAGPAAGRKAAKTAARPSKGTGGGIRRQAGSRPPAQAPLPPPWQHHQQHQQAPPPGQQRVWQTRVERHQVVGSRHHFMPGPQPADQQPLLPQHPPSGSYQGRPALPPQLSLFQQQRHQQQGPLAARPGGQQQQQQQQQRNGRLPSHGVPPCGRGAAGNVGHGRGQAHKVPPGKSSKKGPAVSTQRLPEPEVEDEEGGLDDIVAALRDAQSPAKPPLLRAPLADGPDPQHAAADGAAGGGDGIARDYAGGAGTSPRKWRRWQPSAELGAAREAARAALEADAPELLAHLHAHHLLPRLALLQPPAPAPPPTAGADNSGGSLAAVGTSSGREATPGAVFAGVTRALERLFPAAAHPSSLLGMSHQMAPTLEQQRQQEQPPSSRIAATGDGDASAAAHEHGQERQGQGQSQQQQNDEDLRPLAALKTLVDFAEESAGRGEPLQWGWCRELRAFMFVFEACHRIVLEVPEYGNATYFFELESPMPVAEQVQRLIAVLSARGVGKSTLLTDAPLDVGRLSHEERDALTAAGWVPGAGLRSLLNFTGERIDHRGYGTAGSTWRQRLMEHLRAGAGGGRVHKPLPGAMLQPQLQPQS